MEPLALRAGPASRPATLLLALLALAAALLMVDTASAGTGDAELTPLYTTLTGWMTGFLAPTPRRVRHCRPGGGRHPRLADGFVRPVAAGTGLFLAPDIIDATVSATLPVLG